MHLFLYPLSFSGLLGVSKRLKLQYSHVLSRLKAQMRSFTKSVFTSSWPSAHLCCSAVGESKSWRIYLRPFEGKLFSKNKSLGDQKSFRNPEKFGSKLRKKIKLEKKSLRVKIEQENFSRNFFLDEKLIV